MRKCALANKNALLAAMAKTAKLYVPVDGADEMRALIPMGPDGIITNRPDILRDILCGQ